MKIDLEIIKSSIRTIPDFPKEGIMFKDITTSLLNPAYFKFSVIAITEHYEKLGITKVIGIESRGFILASCLALNLNAGFVPIRKPGKLPYETFSASYELEYGTDTMEIHTDALNENDVVVIHDDVLATGGTIHAAIDLIKNFGVKKIYVNFFIELSFLNGRANIQKDVEVWSLINY